MAAAKPWLFDVWARFYDIPWVQRAVYRAPQDAVMAELRRRRCERILDLGCGTGKLAARLRRQLPAALIVGCDFSAGMLAEARARDATVGWVRGDASRLPFGDGSFDAVVSTEAFHWFPDQAGALAEMRRVLRPNGRLLLAMVNPRLRVAGTVVHALSSAIGEPFLWPTTADLSAIVRAAGFRVEGHRRLFRLPGMLLFPLVLTVATARRSPAPTGSRGHRAGSARAARHRTPTSHVDGRRAAAR